MKDLNFHYNREERLSMPGAPDLAKGAKRGIFRNNRSLVILLVNVVLLCFIFIFYRIVLYAPSYSQSLAGYDLILRGFPLADKVIATLNIQRKTEEAVSGRVYVRFGIGEEEIRMSQILPENLGANKEVTGSLFVQGVGKVLVTEVQIGEEVRTLSRKLE